MQITELVVSPVEEGYSSGLKAYVRMVLDDSLAIKDIKLMNLNGKWFLGMPSKKLTGRCSCGEKNPLSASFCARCGHELDFDITDNRIYSDLAHPINPEFRKYLEDSVLDEYRRITGH